MIHLNTAYLKIFLFAMISLIVSACGKSLPPLTDAQKQVVKDTMSSFDRTAQAPTDVQSPATTRVGDAPDAADVSLARMRSTLGQAVKDGKCTPHRNTSESAFLISLKGDACPVSFELSFSASAPAAPSTPGGSSNFAMNYDVNDVEFKTFNDIDSFRLSGTIADQSDASKTERSVTIKGTLHSQINGNIALSLGLQMSGTSIDPTVQIEFDLVYPTFEANLKQTTRSRVTSYSINGQEVTAQEFSNYLTGLSGQSAQSVVANGTTTTVNTTENPLRPHPLAEQM